MKVTDPKIGRQSWLVWVGLVPSYESLEEKSLSRRIRKHTATGKSERLKGEKIINHCGWRGGTQKA
jgi:hypothetical protein